jgi:predicted DNA-binding protein (MmcQ/YjbR family)
MSDVTFRETRVTHAELLAYCLAKPGATQDEPWEGDVVAKVGEKIFCFNGDATIGVKCGSNRDDAAELRERYPNDVTVMAYIGRFGWNTVRTDGAVPKEELYELVDASYDAVVAGLPKHKRPVIDLTDRAADSSAEQPAMVQRPRPR